ncbi:MAG TPA: hypothetical protein VJ814_05085 [Gaiellaceae bacterium]|nr:hypothetical protein [Gaiellaceae bacterium]
MPLERHAPGRAGVALRTLGAVAVLVVGVVHLEQYLAVHFDVIPVIGPLFVLNFAGAAVMALGLLIPALPRLLHALLALGAIGLAVTSFVFLMVSEHRPLFGFEDYGYRPAILIVFAAEALTVLLLGAYLAVQARSR